MDASDNARSKTARYGHNDHEIALGRKNALFAGSDEGGRRAAAIYTLIETCKLNDIDACAWLADVLTRINDHPMHRIDQLLHWNWKPQ